MKARIFLAIFVMFLYFSCSSLGDGIYTDFDQFSKKHIVTGVVRLKQEQGFETFKIVFTYNDINSNQPFAAYLYTETTIWYYFHRIGFIIDDGEPVYRDNTKFLRNILHSQKANEMVYFDFSREEIEAMALAKDVYFQLEGEKFKVRAGMTKRNINTLKKFLRKVDQIQAE